MKDKSENPEGILYKRYGKDRIKKKFKKWEGVQKYWMNIKLLRNLVPQYTLKLDVFDYNRLNMMLI